MTLPFFFLNLRTNSLPWKSEHLNFLFLFSSAYFLQMEYLSARNEMTIHRMYAIRDNPDKSNCRCYCSLHVTRIMLRFFFLLLQRYSNISYSIGYKEIVDKFVFTSLVLGFFVWYTTFLTIYHNIIII